MAGVVRCVACGKKNRVPVAAKGVPRCAQCKGDIPWMVDADDYDFDDATASKLPVLVDLWAPWCGPCRTMAPGLEQVAAELAGKVKVVKVNVDDSPRTQARFEAMSIPTLVILKDGKKVASKVGAMPPAQLKAWVESTVGA